MEWKGDLAQMAEFLGFMPAVTSGLLMVPLAGGEAAVVQIGWWVYRDSMGLGVVSAQAAARWVPQAA